MSIVTRPATREYREGYDLAFPPKKRPNECRIYNTTCPTPELCRLNDPEAPCVAGQANDDTGEGSMTLGELEAKLKGDGE